MGLGVMDEGAEQTKVFFAPWIGENYGAEKSIFKKKILVLGGSHYCDDCATCGDRILHPGCVSFTRDRIKEYLDLSFRARWKKTYTSFVNSVYGVPSSRDQKIQLFSSICFYNYLQIAAGNDPSSAHLYNYKDKNHLDAFYEVIGKLFPDIVISWGEKVWDALPDEWGYGMASKGPILSVTGGNFTSYQTYPYKEKSILLIGVHHPSSGCDRQKYHEVYSALGVVPICI